MPMSDILEDLYYGNVCPSEDYMKLLQDRNQSTREEQKEQFASFRSSLSKEQSALFQKLMDLQLQALPMEHAAVFASGFRLGAQIMLEVLRPPK